MQSTHVKPSPVETELYLGWPEDVLSLGRESGEVFGVMGFIVLSGSRRDRQTDRKNAGVCMLWHACRGQKTTSDGTLPSALIKAFSLLFLHCVCQTSSPMSLLPISLKEC